MGKVIITKAPLRVSFAGGGTDLNEFYSKEVGSVVSTTINKYIYIFIKEYFHNKLLLRYSEIEEVDNVSDIKHPIIREALKMLNLTKGIEINSMADIPAKTGVGSSSAFTVALLHALHAFKGEHVSAEQLAREASHVEINLVKNPIGKQDQYSAAYGGLNFIEFYPNESVIVTPLLCKEGTIKSLNENLMMFYTGIQRDANSVLQEQKDKTEEKRMVLRKMKLISEELKFALLSGDLDLFAAKMHESWLEKKSLTHQITTSLIDDYYTKAINAGAKGGKLLGAGGGGFLLFYCERDKQDKVRIALSGLKELSFKMDLQGSRIIYVGD